MWVKVTTMVGMFWYVSLLGWACFTAAGGKMNGLKKAIAAGVAGMFWVAVGEFLVLSTGALNLEWVALGVAMFIIVVEAKLPLLSFIPAGLCGAAVIGAGGPVGIFDAPTNIKLAISFVVGPVLGYIAEWAGGMITKKA
ncbi:MAG: hypothetical protein AUH42_05045 [Gemmatimonadetes bacterium 13_1_40CM_70_11]|nr:MAG: hypothetical protein AUH42_05045 [Gemmatimonadetes bacterium 13_1_40CM_70_11]